MDNLKRTIMVCINYQQKKGNYARVKQLEEKLKRIEEHEKNESETKNDNGFNRVFR